MGSTYRQGTAPSPQRCADEVLDIVPQVMGAVRGAMRRHVGEQLSVPQFRGLDFIGTRPGASIGDVAASLGVTMPTASAMVDRLMKAGQVTSRTSAQDRRRLELELTAAGRAHLTQIRCDAHIELAQQLDACSSDELQQLSAGLAVLRRVFGTGPAD